MEAYKYLIIGGTTKAATTSLFNYLSEHPDVNPSTIKETRFFLDKAYPKHSKYRFEIDGVDYYDHLFMSQNREEIRVEATPDYLYDYKTPIWIKEHLSDAKFVFLLREPTSRFLSWFNFSKQKGLIDANTTLNQYLQQQKQGSNIENFEVALEQGNYSKYLQHYFDIVGKENVLVLFFEDLEKDILQSIKKVCSFRGINSDFFDTYDFKIHNKTSYTAKNRALNDIYSKIVYKARYAVHDLTKLRKFLKKVRWILIEPIYQKINTKRIDKELNAEEKETIKKIKTYYQEEYNALGQLLGSHLPW